MNISKTHTTYDFRAHKCSQLKKIITSLAALRQISVRLIQKKLTTFDAEFTKLTVEWEESQIHTTGDN